jgi:hypothetical protein
MRYSQAKEILKQLKALDDSRKNWEGMKDIYDQYDFPSSGISPWYNVFTAQVQKWDMESIKVGEKTGLYFSNKKSKVSAWTGKQLGKIVNLSYFNGSGFAPCKKVSITFTFKGMVFRGICAYENMECFTAKRIK